VAARTRKEKGKENGRREGVLALTVPLIAEHEKGEKKYRKAKKARSVQ